MHNPRIAIVHDSVTWFGGAERVLLSLVKAFPRADVFTASVAWEHLGPSAKLIARVAPRTSWVQRFGPLRRHPFLYRPLLPLLWRSFDLTPYDIVISSSGSQMSHLVRVRPDATHIYYCFTPPRHLYGFETDFDWRRTTPLRLLAVTAIAFLRRLDRLAARKVKRIIAISTPVASRIRDAYGIDPKVIFPPVTIPKVIGDAKHCSRYFLSVSRLSRMKHVDLVVRACSAISAPLVVVGTGPEEDALKRLAGPTIRFVGAVDEKTLAGLYRGCAAVICAAKDEDFGIVPVEAMAYGKPVVAYRSGGFLDSVTRDTGVYFERLTPDSIIGAMRAVLQRRFSADALRRRARSFSESRFIAIMRSAVSEIHRETHTKRSP